MNATSYPDWLSQKTNQELFDECDELQLGVEAAKARGDTAEERVLSARWALVLLKLRERIDRPH